MDEIKKYLLNMNWDVTETENRIETCFRTNYSDYVHLSFIDDGDKIYCLVVPDLLPPQGKIWGKMVGELLESLNKEMDSLKMYIDDDKRSIFMVFYITKDATTELLTKVLSHVMEVVDTITVPVLQADCYSRLI